jgi:branched-chain amino acid transport system permease protein
LIIRPSKWSIIATLVGALIIVLLPLVLGDTHQYRFAFVGCYFIAALGLQILTGYAGQISLGHSGFMMIGAYTTLILSVDHGWNAMATVPLGGLFAGIAGFLFGFPALRLRGVYLALATFAIPIALTAFVKKYPDFTGGGSGKPMNEVLTGHQAYVRVWPVAGVLFVVAWLLLAGKLGRAFRTIRESEIAAVSSGINLAGTKTTAFGISAFFAGVGGSLFAITLGFINPDPFGITLSILLLVGVIVGGLGSLVGVIFGALFIEYIPLYAPDILGWVEKPFGSPLDPKRAGAPAAVYGFILLLILYLIPSGVAGLLRSALRFIDRRFKLPNTKAAPQVSSTRREA